MPQVHGSGIKTRAARLRAAGQAQVDKHLEAQIGQTHQVLMEPPRMGRTAQFAEVAFSSDQPEGQIVSAHITGHANGQLIA